MDQEGRPDGENFGQDSLEKDSGQNLAESVNEALARVNGPAIGLMVTAILGILTQLLTVLLTLIGAGFQSMGMHQMGRKGMAHGPELEQLQYIQELVFGVGGTVSGVIGIAIGVFILIGSLKMKRLESYGLSMAAAILALIPCISPCCILGLPFGIWALVVLSDQSVKAMFST